MSGWRVIVQIQTSGRSECLTFPDIAVVDPAHIAIVAAEPSAASAAERLFDAIVQQLGRLQEVSRCGAAGLLKCMGRLEPTCKSVLVVVTGPTPLNGQMRQLAEDWTRTRRGRATGFVLPILPSGSDPAVVLPSPLDQNQVVFDSGATELLAPDVLRRAAIGGVDHRLFISYRRDDARSLADQLHQAFVRAGFKVYLDRFSGNPGQPFPRQIAEELADKGLVLVIESPNLLSSTWVLDEVALAATMGLGLIAVRMPFAPWFGAIHDRFDATDSGKWQNSTTADPLLKAPVVDDVVQFVRRQYVKQMLYRRVYLESQLRYAWRQTGLVDPVSRSGLYELASSSVPVQRYMIHLASRPPRLADIRRVTVAAGTTSHPIVVGPVGLLPEEDHADILWLGSKVALSLADEGLMLPLAASVKKGKTPL